MTNRTYVVHGSDGQLYGPADVATLNQWALEGRILAGTVLIETGTNRQVAARDLPGLQHHFQLSPSPQQPPYAQGQQPGSPTIHQPYQPGAGQQPGSGGAGQPGSHSPYPRSPNPINVLYGTQRRTKLVAALLAFLVGTLGIHRFYLGYTKIGIAMLAITILGNYVFCGMGWLISGTWAIVDGIMILTDNLKDADGQPLD